MTTKNITLKIDASIYQKAREFAAGEATSVSALVADYLVKLASSSPPSEAEYARRAKRLQALWDQADQRDAGKSGSLVPMSREEIYAERIRR